MTKITIEKLGPAKTTVNNYCKSIGKRDEDGKLTDVKFFFFDGRNRMATSDARLWSKSEALAGRQVSIFKRIPGLSEAVSNIGDFSFSS
ncbi:MAG: hypothetical protein KGL39_18155 [Patescibacteria group bacterium]|nr:hypothetical protein [Patescibacteria group bacterium]